jgi:protein arginine N-methyltransferase 5
LALEVSTLSENLLLNINRWNGEPVKAIVIYTKFFAENKKGKPILPTILKTFLSFFFKFSVNIIIRGRSKYGENNYKPYVRYLEMLSNKLKLPMSLYDKFCFPYRDSLRTPLQPLMDNLQSETYSVMEQDPVKYDTYELAIKRAMTDLWKLSMNSVVRTSGASVASTVSGLHTLNKHKKLKLSNKVNDALIVVVVGPGRGPLICRVILASKSTKIPVKIYAVEKNLNAVITLRNRVITDDWDCVTVIHSDMRNWAPSDGHKADILVSELLGSWGDNELRLVLIQSLKLLYP